MAPRKSGPPGRQGRSSRAARPSRVSAPARADEVTDPVLAGDAPAQGAHEFPVVGVGASAGGLEAFSELLGTMPADAPMALVLVQHLDPKHSSLLTDLLARTTPMRVVEVRPGMRVEPSHVYVIPPNTTITITGGVLQLSPRPVSPEPHMPIDIFLRSLAEDCRDRAIGVVLSGTASDGALGIKEAAAVGEGVRRYVEDAHHRRASEREQPVKRLGRAVAGARGLGTGRVDLAHAFELRCRGDRCQGARRKPWPVAGASRNPSDASVAVQKFAVLGSSTRSELLNQSHTGNQ